MSPEYLQLQKQCDADPKNLDLLGKLAKLFDQEGGHKGKGLEHWAKVMGKSSGKAKSSIKAMKTYGLVIPLLICALEHEDELVRWNSSGTVELLTDRQELLVPALTKLVADEDEDVRQNAARALGQIGPPASQATTVLIEALKNDDNKLRWLAARALGQIGPDAKDAILSLVSSLDSSDAELRASAAEALGRMRAEAQAVFERLEASLLDSEEPVIKAAAKALSLIGDGSKSFPVLIEALGHQRKEVHYAAADALGELKSKPEFYTLLLQCGRSENVTRRDLAFRILESVCLVGSKEEILAVATGL